MVKDRLTQVVTSDLKFQNDDYTWPYGRSNRKWISPWDEVLGPVLGDDFQERGKPTQNNNYNPKRGRRRDCEEKRTKEEEKQWLGGVQRDWVVGKVKVGSALES